MSGGGRVALRERHRTPHDAALDPARARGSFAAGLALQAWQGAGANERSGFFEKYASELGLNIDQYKQDLTSKAVTEKINRDRSTAQKFKATSTPTFVLNGQVLPESASVNADEFKRTVEQALKDAGYKLDEPAQSDNKQQ